MADHPMGKPDGSLGEETGEIIEDGNAPHLGAARHFLEEPVGQRRDDGNGDDQRQNNGHRNGDGDVLEQLPDFEVHGQDRREHHYRSQRRDQHRTPDLLRSQERRLGGVVAFLAQPVDVFQHDNGGIDHHADGESNPGQGNDVDRPSHEGHGHEGTDHGNRYGQRYDQGGGAGTQEQQQDQGGQCTTDIDILFDQIDGGIDVGGLVVDLGQFQLGGRQDGFIQFSDRRVNAFHRIDDVGSGFAGRVEDHRRFAEAADGRRRFFVAKGHIGDIADRDPRDTAGLRVFQAPQDNRFHVVDGFQFTFGAHHIAAFAFLDVAGRDRGVGGAQGLHYSWHSKAVLGHAVGIDDDLHLPFTAAKHID